MIRTASKILLLIFTSSCLAQVTFKVGPEIITKHRYIGVNKLANNSKMYGIIQGDANSFYGDLGWLHFMKIDKSSLNEAFVKDYHIPSEVGTLIYVVDVKYAFGHMYIFKKLYNHSEHRLTLYMQSVSSSAEIEVPVKIISSVTAEKEEDVDLSIKLNPSKTTFAVCVVHKENTKQPLSDLILYDTKTMGELERKTVNLALCKNKYFDEQITTNKQSNVDFIDWQIDDNNNIHYLFTEQKNNEDDKKDIFNLRL